MYVSTICHISNHDRKTQDKVRGKIFKTGAEKPHSEEKEL